MSAVVPVAVVVLLAYALFCRVRVFTAFTDGAAKALPLLGRLIPSLAAILAAITVLRDSGALDALIRLLTPACTAIGVDPALLPLILLRPLSGSAAIAVLSDLFLQYGPDSPIGMTGSVLLGASETLLYTLAVYFGAVGVRKTRFTIPLALVATATSVGTGLLFGKLFFG